MSEATIGTQMAIRAVLHIGIAFLYAPLERFCGSTVRCYRMVMWGWPLTTICAPLLNVMARRGLEGSWSFNIAMLVFFVIWAGSGFAWSKYIHTLIRTYR